ncbi:MAG TPA: LamG-like jellyroll fold domain-containing protein [Solirubrobacteraceae bacterium]|nr:LamG-like jellyroll fold domain-containing protein [Solirubrobacteraceae bacterium]
MFTGSPWRARAALAFVAAFVIVAVPAQAQERTVFDARNLASQQLVAAAAPAGFTETAAISGLTAPTAVRFAPDGRVFVAEKRGRILMYDSISDPTPTVWADFNQNVHDFWDRGLLGMALDPNFATRPYVYALYAYNKDPNSTTRWGDNCPTPPGATGDGCVIGGRLSRFTAGGTEQVLIEDFCQQYPSHSIGSLAFGNDGALYVSAGDGASFNFADYGQDGSPLNPCGDPPGGVGGTMTPPTAEGGALRSQDVRSTGDPTGLDGAILRVDPDTGAAMPDNANAGSADPNSRRIIGYGLRNPFRITVRPGTNEIWAGDVGWNTWEEINRLQNPTGAAVNYGWPCYEGNSRQSGYDNLNLNLCETLYAQGASAVANPYYTYNHSAQVVTGETCPTGGSSISGLAFYTGGSFGPAYDGALFFSDYSRNCIWVMFRGSNGLPDPATRQTFVAQAAGPVELQMGPDGDLYYVDMNGGTIRRIHGPNSNQAPTAVATATPSSGAVPLTVNFSGAGSSDPNPGTTLSYAWDLDGDGAFDDSTSQAPSRTYTTPGIVTVRLRVSDGSLTDTTTVTVTAGTPPTATVTSPASGTTWRTGDTITFSGTATDFLGNAIAPGSLSWRVLLQHCNRTNSTCHTHVLQTLTGAGGSLVAPEHEYPSYLELELTATDTFGLTRTVTRRLDPRTVPITLASNPAGVGLTLGTETAAAPFTLDVIQGSHLPITAPSPVTIGGTSYEFTGWSDGGARTHDITAGTTAATYTANFQVSQTPTRVAGTDVIGLTGSDATTGRAEVYRTSATSTARVTSIGLRLAPGNTATAVVLGLYADSNGQPTTLLASGRINSPAAGAWNEVAIDNGPTINAGTAYWIALLNPSDATGVLRWHDRAQTGGGAEQGSASSTLAALPGTWATGPVWNDGPLSAYVMGVPPGPPPPPALAVTPASLTFSGTAGGANPASKTLSVTNSGGGSLSFTASDDAPWLTVTPGSGSAPATLTAAVSLSGLAAGDYSATITVDGGGVNGSPKQIPVTLTVAPPQPPALSVSPGSLSFTAVEGAAAPPAQSLSVTNTGGGSLSFTTSDDATWLSAAPASGTAPGSVSVSVSHAGLARGTYTGNVVVTAAGATGSPRTIPVTLTVAPPATGLVGAWSFDEASGATAGDASGTGNDGTVSGAARTTGRYGGALSFDGVNDWVSINDANSLDLTNRMTLEAWVRPTGLGDWRTVVIKERPGQLAYALYASTDNNRPSGHVFTTADIATRSSSVLPANTWSHLAFTYDGAATRLYVNGTQVATGTLTGSALTSSSPLRIGGNSVWGEWFSGAIDEVRIYNRALTATEIATDRDTAIGGATVAALALRAARPSAHAKKKLKRARKLTRDLRKYRRHRGTKWLNGAGARPRGGRGSRAHRRAAHRRHQAGRRL